MSSGGGEAAGGEEVLVDVDGRQGTADSSGYVWWFLLLSHVDRCGKTNAFYFLCIFSIQPSNYPSFESVQCVCGVRWKEGILYGRYGMFAPRSTRSGVPPMGEEHGRGYEQS